MLRQMDGMKGRNEMKKHPRRMIRRRDRGENLCFQFLRALRQRDFQQAKRLCNMILIYEPHHPEASEFLPLIQRKLLEGKDQTQNLQVEDSDDSDSDDDADDPGCDEE
uniref:Glutamate-rich protein 2 n=1 Tax=Hippocampus comes TaxID=109280 RepID=A0A3Q2XDX2_HIPCM